MRIRSSKVTLLALIGVCLLGGSGTAYAESFSIRIGALMPRAQSDIWDLNVEETTFTKTRLIGGMLGAGLDIFWSRWVNTSLFVYVYERDMDVEDRDFVYPDGTPIARTISLNVVPIELTLKFLPLGRMRRGAIPYLGGGVGLYVWKYQEIGDFVFDRFGDPFIDFGDFQASGVEFGWHVLAGLQIRIGRRSTLDLEIKYHDARGDMGRDFPGFNPIDLSGVSLLTGISFWW